MQYRLKVKIEFDCPHCGKKQVSESQTNNGNFSVDQDCCYDCFGDIHLFGGITLSIS